MATHIEMSQLGEAALRAIARALSQGDEQGYKELWRSQSILEHIAHAGQHLLEGELAGSKPDARKEELQHALIRCAMALHLLHEQP